MTCPLQHLIVGGLLFNLKEKKRFKSRFQGCHVLDSFLLRMRVLTYIEIVTLCFAELLRAEITNQEHLHTVLKSTQSYTIFDKFIFTSDFSSFVFFIIAT